MKNLIRNLKLIYKMDKKYVNDMIFMQITTLILGVFLAFVTKSRLGFILCSVPFLAMLYSYFKFYKPLIDKSFKSLELNNKYSKLLAKFNHKE